MQKKEEKTHLYFNILYTVSTKKLTISCEINQTAVSRIWQVSKFCSDHFEH